MFTNCVSILFLCVFDDSFKKCVWRIQQFHFVQCSENNQKLHFDRAKIARLYQFANPKDYKTEFQKIAVLNWFTVCICISMFNRKLNKIRPVFQTDFSFKSQRSNFDFTKKFVCLHKAKMHLITPEINNCYSKKIFVPIYDFLTKAAIFKSLDRCRALTIDITSFLLSVC